MRMRVRAAALHGLCQFKKGPLGTTFAITIEPSRLQEPSPSPISAAVAWRTFQTESQPSVTCGAADLTGDLRTSPLAKIGLEAGKNFNHRVPQELKETAMRLQFAKTSPDSQFQTYRQYWQHVMVKRHGLSRARKAPARVRCASLAERRGASRGPEAGGALTTTLGEEGAVANVNTAKRGSRERDAARLLDLLSEKAPRFSLSFSRSDGRSLGAARNELLRPNSSRC